MSVTRRCSSPRAVALLAPKQLRQVLSDGGAEVVVERRTSGKKRMFVSIPDEHDLEGACRRYASHAAVHQHLLEELRWARKTIWSDERLQSYLYTSDHLTWPNLKQLASMVSLAWSARETDPTPDFAAANDLRKALGVIRREVLYAGLHPLREEASSGRLMAFKSESGNGSAVGDTLHAIGGEDGNLGDSVWSLELHTPSFVADDVLRLPLTAQMQETCVDLLRINLAANTIENTWSAVLSAHHQSKENCQPGLFYSVPDGISLFCADVTHVAQLVSESAKRGLRVRLRVGVYFTIIQRCELYVLTYSPDLDDGAGDDLELRASFERVVGRSYTKCLSSGLFLHIRGEEKIKDVLRFRFLGPLSSKYQMHDTVALTRHVSCTHVVVQHNPFVIIHGPRVVEGFPENASARTTLLELLLSREGTTSTSRPSPAGAQTAPSLVVDATSTTFTGEELRRGVDEAVLKTLSLEPMTKNALAAHANMARFRGVHNFDLVLKDSLKRIAEYQGKKYRLKE